MIPALQQFPRFEKGSPSTEYQQIINFCVNYLEGMLVGLIHMDIPVELEAHASEIKLLQQRLISRERTVRHAFQFQIEKYFSDFKSISRTRLRINFTHTGLSDHKTSRIQDIIQSIGGKHQDLHKNQLQNTARRFKALVHRSDGNQDDNPISPLNLGKAFLASIETLNLSIQKNRYLFQLFDHTLTNQLDNFYNQIDLGLYYLDILTELTDPSLFMQPEKEIEIEPEPEREPFSESDSTGHILEPEQGHEDADLIDTIKTESSDQAEPEKNTSSVTTIESHIKKIQHKQLEIERCLTEFKANTENGTLDFEHLFSDLVNELSPLVDKKQRADIHKFVHFFISLLNNTLLTTPLKTQLSRLSCPLLEMVLIDPFFFRSSSHPVNDFLQSIVDFELRFKHQSESLAVLSQAIASLLDINKPALSDYQPLIENYENFKKQEVIRLEIIKEEKIKQEEKLKTEILQLINEITAELVVEQQTMQFFYDDWQRLLLHLAKKLGKESAEFKNSVNIAKMLSWFLDENKTGFHPGFETTSFKSLLTSIEIGLVTLNFSAEHRHRARKQLVAEYKQANEKQDFSVIPSLNANNSQHKLRTANSYNHPSIEDALQIIKELNMGDWVEIKRSTNTDFSRAKLKWKAVDCSLFIFIDQRGHKIKEFDLAELELEFSSGNIRVLKKPSFRQNVYF